MRDWKNNPPKNKEEGWELLLYLHREGMKNAAAKYGPAFAGRVERRGNYIVHVWADGTEDLYEANVEYQH